MYINCEYNKPSDTTGRNFIIQDLPSVLIVLIADQMFKCFAVLFLQLLLSYYSVTTHADVDG